MIKKSGKKVFKIVKTWYVEEESIIGVVRDKLATMRQDAHETKITEVK